MYVRYGWFVQLADGLMAIAYSTNFHPHGTCAMGKVVDAELRVKVSCEPFAIGCEL